MYPACIGKILGQFQQVEIYSRLQNWFHEKEKGLVPFADDRNLAQLYDMMIILDNFGQMYDVMINLDNFGQMCETEIHPHFSLANLALVVAEGSLAANDWSRPFGKSLTLHWESNKTTVVKKMITLVRIVTFIMVMMMVTLIMVMILVTLIMVMMMMKRRKSLMITTGRDHSAKA